MPHNIVRCEHRIAFVLQQFEAMGMTDRAKEEERLRSDDEYYVEWCLDIETWCPGWDGYRLKSSGTVQNIGN